MPGALLCTGGDDGGGAELTVYHLGIQHKPVKRQRDNCRDLVRELMALDLTLTV